ncbi:DUF3418 domain-containing protein, partial [Neisseria gonorrhoeae]
MFPDFSQTLSKDRHFLQSAFKNPNKYGGLSKIEEKYRKSHEIFLKRLAALPKPEFDNTLPVHEKLEEIKKTVAENQVTIICGETGSGKTTQLPKICLELGRGAAGLIGHTQPRRLAARSVAERIAEELKSEIGSAVGYKVRFTDHTSRDACVKLMTDGILLAETQTDRYLAAYDTIIIDEAHERSLNIDFLLGYLKQLLPRRPVSYGKVAPEEAREIFIRSALVAQEYDLKADFFVHNKKLIKEITELEHKSRKQDVLVDDEALFAFYHERLPDFYMADSVSEGLCPANPQQTTPSPVGEGWGEGKTVAAQTNFSATSASPLPNPLPQEREQSASVSTVSGSLKTMSCEARLNFCEAKTKTESSLHSQRLSENYTPPFSDGLRPANPQQTTPSPVGEGWGEGKTVAAQTNFSATAANPLPQEREQSASALTVSDDPKPKKQPASQKGRLKPLPLADIRTFEAWLKTAERDNPRLLFLSRDDLMQHAAAHITEEQFPKHWQTADGKFKLSYRFEPHHPLDGVTLTLPLTVLNRISPAALEWLVPGMIREKIQLQIKALPKQIRRICVPVPEFITQFLSQNPDRNAPILPQLAQAIAKTAGDIRILEQINQDEWAAFRLPEHCYFNLRIIDDGGQELAMGRDLIQIQQQLGKAATTTFRDNTQEFERDNVTAWDIGILPESIKFARGKQQLTGYLGLQKEKDGRIALRLFDTSAAAGHAHRLGVIELMKLQLKEQVKDLNKGIQGFTQAAMLLKHINADTLRDDLTQAVCDRAFIGEDKLPRNEKSFKEQIKRARSRLPAVKEALSRYLQETAAAYAELNGKLGKHPLTHLLRLRLQTLLAPGFATRTPWAQWSRLPIYLKAMTLRLEKYSSNPARDAAREADIQELEQMWQEKTDGLAKQGQPVSDGLAAFKWMIEELRVSLFAQELKTPYPVSVKRLLKMW